MESPEGFDEEASDYDDVPLSTSTGNKRSRKSGSGSSSKAKGKGQSKKDDDGNDPASVRKLQNRTAQREFRQRKLQYVKDLEARVEFLSSPKDNQLEILKALLHGFIEENKQLRTLLQSITKFIGSGMGGRATELGFDKDENLDDFVNRSDRGTLNQLYEEFRASLKENSSQSGVGNAGGTVSAEPRTAAMDSETNKARSTRSSSVPPLFPPTADKGAQGKKGSDENIPKSNLATGSSRNTQKGPSPSTMSHSNRSPLEGNMTMPPSQSFQPQPQPTNQNVANQYGINQSHVPNFAFNFPSSANEVNSYNSSASRYGINGGLDQSTSGMPTSSQASGSMPMTIYNNNQPQQSQQQASASNDYSSSAFFFDRADPMSMPMSSFTNDFLNEYISTGLTPLFDPANVSGYNWNPIDHHANTPSSSTSSQNNYNPSTVQNVNDVMSPSRNATIQQRDALEERIANQITAKHRAKYNLPQGLTPADIISSNPMLTLCYTISSHMRNKAANPNYILPEALQPTALQIATPHDFRIDGMLSKNMRDALIMHSEYNLDELLTDLVDTATVHSSESQDILDPINVEMSESFLRKYPNIFTPADIAIMNHWRRKRGEPDIIR